MVSMPKKASDDLSRKGEPSQKTKGGLKIPVPKTEEFDRLLKKAAERKKAER